MEMPWSLRLINFNQFTKIDFNSINELNYSKIINLITSSVNWATTDLQLVGFCGVTVVRYPW